MVTVSRSDASVVVVADAPGAEAPPPRQPDTTPGHERAWTGPEPIEGFPDLAYAAQVVMDELGNATVVWRQNERSPHAEGVGANRFDRRTARWGQARFIDDGKHSTTCPSLAVDGRGNTVAVWEQERTFGWPHDVHAARFDIGADVWYAPELVGQSDSEGMLCPVVGLDSTGNGSAVWLESKSTSGHSIHQSLFRGGAWRSPSKLQDELCGNPGYPQVAVEPGGNTTVMWAEIDGRHTGLYLRTMDSEGRSSIPDVVLSSYPCYAPTLAIDPWGSAAAVAWIAPGGSSARVHVAFRNQPGGVWREEPLSDIIPAASLTPAVAVGRNSAVLMWRQGADDVDIFASRRDANGTWQTPARLDGEAWTYTVPRVALDGHGNVIATWQKGSTEASRVVAARYDAALAAWSEPVLLDNGAGWAESPTLAVDSAGRAVVVWSQRRDGGGSHLWANRWE